MLILKNFLWYLLTLSVLMSYLMINNQMASYWFGSFSSVRRFLNNILYPHLSHLMVGSPTLKVVSFPHSKCDLGYFCCHRYRQCVRDSCLVDPLNPVIKYILDSYFCICIILMRTAMTWYTDLYYFELK